MKSANIYRILSKVYDLLDIFYFNIKGVNPRKIILDLIPDKQVKILDLCCGTGADILDIALQKQNTEIIGIDLSESMLEVGKEKIAGRNIPNISFQQGDATDISLQSGSIDYIIIGLVLHEISPELAKKMLQEAYRLLKEDGKLIILEWERQKSLLRRMKFEPLRFLEVVNCSTFKNFYSMDKPTYFREHGFITKSQYHCNYTTVLELTK